MDDEQFLDENFPDDDDEYYENDGDYEEDGYDEKDDMAYYGFLDNDNISLERVSENSFTLYIGDNEIHIDSLQMMLKLRDFFINLKGLEDPNNYSFS